MNAPHSIVAALAARPDLLETIRRYAAVQTKGDAGAFVVQALERAIQGPDLFAATHSSAMMFSRDTEEGGHDDSP